MSSTWKTLETAPAGRKITGTDGTVYYIAMGTPSYSNKGPRPYALVQPGRGLTMTRLHGSELEPAPAEQVNSYARQFGNTPGPEWSVNGRPFAEWVRVWTDAELAKGERPHYTDADYVEFGSLNDVTDAGRKAIEAWLTSDAVMAELFSPVNLAECAARDAARELRDAERDEQAARAALKKATEERRAAVIRDRIASTAHARAIVAASAEVTA